VKQSRDGFQDLNRVNRKTATFSKHIHAVILVLKANDPRLEEGIYKGTLQKIRDYFRTQGNNDINQWLLTIRPVACRGYGSIAHEAKLNGLLTRGP